MKPNLNRHLLILWLWAAVTVPASAAFVVDEFDDAVEVVSPNMYETPVITPNVGVLNAVRTIEIDGSSSINPTARFDASVSSTSRLSANLSALNVRTSLTPILGFEFDYAFNSFDISEGGVNDAIAFDFTSIAGTRSPTFLRGLVRDASGATFESRIAGLPLVSGPMTVRIPFSSFTLRGGAPGLPDFTTMDQLDFDFFFLGGSDPVQWSMQMERIRIGRVPEPSTASILFIGLAIKLAAFRVGR